MTAIIDYGVGNLFSLSSSLNAINESTVITGNADEINKADRLILPGVGAFADAAAKLKQTGLDEIIKEKAKSGTPLLGICLGMQLLFDKSFEFGEHQGLGLIGGEVVPMNGRLPQSFKIPHIGWNSLKFTKKNKLFRYINDGDFVYFVHSFFAGNCSDSLIATTEYGIPITAAAANGNVFGCQFHPEKSGETGLKILKAFCETEKEQ